MTEAVFVSYAGRDLAWAEWVAWQLRDAGYQVELDRWDWAAGDNFMLRMSAALADLPLAMAQAAGVLTETGLSPARYVLELAKHTDEVLAEGTPAGYPEPLAAAIALSLDRLAAEDEAALQLLRHCAAMAPEPIPLDVFDTAPLLTVAGSTIALSRGIGRLGRYGLARVSEGTIQLHRLTQAIVAATDPDRAGTRRTVAALLATAVPDDTGNEPATWPRWAQKLHDRWRQDLGPDHHRRARDIDEDALARRRRIPGDDHPDTRRAAWPALGGRSGGVSRPGIAGSSWRPFRRPRCRRPSRCGRGTGRRSRRRWSDP